MHLNTLIILSRHLTSNKLNSELTRVHVSRSREQESRVRVSIWSNYSRSKVGIQPLVEVLSFWLQAGRNWSEVSSNIPLSSISHFVERKVNRDDWPLVRRSNNKSFSSTLKSLKLDQLSGQAFFRAESNFFLIRISLRGFFFLLFVSSPGKSTHYANVKLDVSSVGRSIRLG